MPGTPAIDALIRLNHASVVASLVSGLIHDFNNSLLVIGGSVELLEEAQPGDDPRPRLERIRRQHAAMAGRLRELGGVLKPDGTETRADARAVVTQACAFREAALRRQAVAVQVEDAAGVVVAIPPDHLLQIVLNLLLNAEAAVAGRERREIAWAVVRAGGEVRISVSDSGPGPGPGVRDHLFEPFVTSAPDERAGLGLHVSRTVAERAGGALTLAYGPDGTIATLTLPVA
ncbi:MAG: ATP-binding protein [Vicinamibacterales bacterium]